MSEQADRNDMDPPDGLASLIAHMDQALAMAPHIATMARGWFDAFVDRGPDEKQALYLTGVQLIQNPGSP